MSAPEYIQLQAFARVHGLKLFVLWLGSFLCYVYGLRVPGLSLLAMLLAVLTPFLASHLLRTFRDNALNGVISFLRGWLYEFLLFFYASLLFAAMQFLYFTFIDKGQLINELTDILTAPEVKETFRQMGINNSLEETLHMMSSLRPIDIVLNILLSNIMIGCFLGVPIAAFRTMKEQKQN